MTNDNSTIIDAARRFGQSLPPEKHPDGQEALRFARWFGDDRPAVQIKPSDLENYVESFGSHAPNAAQRADSLKGFLSYAHKQKILPERLVSHVRVRRTVSRARGNALSDMDQIQLTAEGKLTLEKELAELISQRPHMAEELHNARADGDVRENAPLEAAREAQGQLEARIRELEGTMRRAVVVEDDDGAIVDRARIGSNIVISNVQTGAQLTYQLVAAAEARQGTGRLSVESPVGRGVLGKRAGDEIQVEAPSGLVRFKVDNIES